MMVNYPPDFLGESPIKKGAPYPATFAKETEHSHQVALMAWCNLPPVKEAFPELLWFHAIGNGGSRGDTAQSRRIEGGKMKAEGVKPGVSDLSLPVRRGAWSGLYIELKKMPGAGVGPSKEQEEFGDFVMGQGFAFAICYGWREARDMIIAYLTQKW